MNIIQPESSGSNTDNTAPKHIPKSADFHSHCSHTHCSNSSKFPQIAVVAGVIIVTVTLLCSGFLTFFWYRRRKQKIGSMLDTSKNGLSTDEANEFFRKTASPLVSIEYFTEWDPLAGGPNGDRFFKELLNNFRFNLEEVEYAIQYSSEVNLLGRSNFSSVYKGILRDGSLVAI